MSIDRLIALVFSCDRSILLQPTTKQAEQNCRLGPVEQAQARMPHQARTSGEAESATIAMRLQYKGRERTTEIQLTHDAIKQLVSRAAFRNIRIGEFVGALLLTVAKKDLFRQVLDTRSTVALDEGGREDRSYR